MRDACVISSVKERMVSRRNLLRTGLGLGTAAVASSVFPQPALAAGERSVADLTHELHEDFPTFFGEQQFFRTQKFNWDEHKFNLLELRVNEHTGTHIDAPLHFSEDGD